VDDLDDDREDDVDELLAQVAHIPPREPGRRDDWVPPSELDEYRLIQPLGRGGMGSVWLAEDRLLDRLVAVKFIARAEPDQRTRERFAFEARATARLSHVNVVTVHRYGEVGGRPYLVSEYIRGDSLDKLAKPIAWERALELGVALARGLAAAHRHGIVHRDIKPANAILAADGEVKLVDFGLAALGHESGAAARGRGPATDAPTDLGPIAGTPRYLAPEVRLGEAAGRRSDVYQIGCILYELVTGRAPILDWIGGETTTLTAERTSREHPAWRRALAVASLGDRIGAGGARFAAVVDRCLRHDPRERFGSGDELREALEQLVPAAGLGALPEGNPYRGLAPFEAGHRALFFGRGAEVRAVVERLRGDPFVVVAGDSGVGKSSLCRAGVLPRIADGALDRRPWSVVQMVPGARPATTLISTIADELGADEAALAALRDEPRAFVRELRRARDGGGILVFVDQLEELSTISERAELEAFAAVLAEMAAGGPRLRVLATVRSDHLTRVAELPAIGVEVRRAIHLLGPLSADGAREAVVGPARATGLAFESAELVETLVRSVADPDGRAARSGVELPLLAFTLAQLWEARESATRTISARSLDAIGGVRGALARHADGVLASLSPEQRRAARRILLRLVSADRMRVRRTAADFAGIDERSEIEGGGIDRAALDALVGGRLVVARGSDEPTYELAHERLIDGWPALGGWITEAAHALEVHARLATAAADWERLGHSSEALWGARQLADLAPLPADDLTAPQARFVAASRARLRRRRWLRGGIAIAAPVIAISLFVGARVLARRDLDRRIASNLVAAEQSFARARAAGAASGLVRDQAFARFDAGDGEPAERAWGAARQGADEAHRALADAARSLEAALLLDSERADVRARLAAVTRERLRLAELWHQEAERREHAGRLALYDPQRAALPDAPAIIDASVAPAGATLTLLDARGRPLAGGWPARGVAAGSYIVEARADGRAPARLPIVVHGGEHRRVAIELLPAAAVPAGYIHVPPGAFQYGSADDDSVRRLFFDTVPIHEVHTPGFLIGRTEVTYAQWIEFLDDLEPAARARHTPRVATSPTVQVGGTLELRTTSGGARELVMTPASIEYRARTGELLEIPDRATRRRQDWHQLPVAGISPDDAIAYAAWLDRTGRLPRARLCTEVEWERAARGADGRPYPHGDHLAGDDANIDETYGRRPGGYGPDTVGAHPASTSPHGLVDTSGNLWEVVRSVTGGFMARGGCFYQKARTAHLANRQGPLPGDIRHDQVGTRICADPP
jgi:eukaryotic-like serine/threonine-protein kinase